MCIYISAVRTRELPLVGGGLTCAAGATTTIREKKEKYYLCSECTHTQEHAIGNSAQPSARTFRKCQQRNVSTEFIDQSEAEEF